VNLRRGALFAAALLVLWASVLRAQGADSGARAIDSTVPPRPRLDSAADTNSAQQNYAYGMRMLRVNAQESLRGFYWATRIDPSSGDALYALWTAKVMTMSNQDLFAYVDHRRGKRTPAQLALDSLPFRAYAMNPFLYSSTDAAMMRRVAEAEIITMFPTITPALLARSVDQRMSAAARSPWAAYTAGHFQDALDGYAGELALVTVTATEEVKKKPNAKEKQYAEIRMVSRTLRQVDIHAKRARIFFQIHQFDSASAEMKTALSLLEAQDSGVAQIVYLSKAMFHQSLGMIYEHDRRFDLARQSYGRALQEDLSYYAAHSHLAQLELDQGDTVDAVSEMDLAVQLAPADPALRFRYAGLLLRVRRDGDAAQQLIRAIALDPYYGSPHLLLATIGDLENYKEDALAEYQKFVALADRTDPQLPRVKTRLAQLTASPASTPTH
jgi:tetratricopeptide (TPR) repeat protein